MRFGKAWLVGLAFTLGVAATAAKPEAPAAGEPEEITTTKHKFTELKLQGQLKKPELSYIYRRKGVKSEKIVNIPEDLDDEIIQGARKF